LHHNLESTTMELWKSHGLGQPITDKYSILVLNLAYMRPPYFSYHSGGGR